MKKIDGFITKIKQTRENLKESILEYLGWILSCRSVIKKKSEEINSKINAGKKKKKVTKNDKFSKFLDFLKISDENLQRIEDSIKKNIYLFKYCVG